MPAKCPADDVSDLLRLNPKRGEPSLPFRLTRRAAPGVQLVEAVVVVRGNGEEVVRYEWWLFDVSTALSAAPRGRLTRRRLALALHFRP